MQLRPCTACNRHVALDATRCPFCAAVLAVGTPVVDPSRLSRAAVFVAGAAAATLGATSLSACWTNKSPTYAQQTAPADAGAPKPDAPVVEQQQIRVDDGDDVHQQNHPCFDGPQGPVCAPYGAPPARRRVV